MKVIYKYNLIINNAVNTIVTDIPISDVLKVAPQRDELCVWIEHDISDRGIGPVGHYVYQVVGTGQQFQQQDANQNVILANENLTYRDSVLMRDAFVWHIYDGFYNEDGI